MRVLQRVVGRWSCRDFRDNQAQLQLFALAYNLGTFRRRRALPRTVKHWSLTTLREKLIKIGGKIVRRARYVTFQLAEVAVPRELFEAILERTRRFGVPPPSPPASWRDPRESAASSRLRVPRIVCGFSNQF